MTIVAVNDTVTYKSARGDNDTVRPADLVVAVAQGAAADGAAASGNPVPVGGIYQTTLPTYDNLDRTQAQFDARGGQFVVLKTGGGATQSTISPATNGATVQSGLWVNSVALVHNGATVDFARKPNATSRIMSAAASTNATSAKASAGDLFKVVGYNAAGAIRYLKIYNKASAPTVGTDTPVLTITLPATAAFEIDFSGQYFSLGIAYALTTGVADADTGALTSGDITGFNLSYA